MVTDLTSAVAGTVAGMYAVRLELGLPAASRSLI